MHEHGFFLENRHIPALRSNNFLNYIYSHAVRPTNFENIAGTRNGIVRVTQATNVHYSDYIISS